MTQKVEISYRTIIFTVIFLIFLGFLYTIRDILLQFFLALLVMTSLDPFVTKLSSYKIPRPLSITLTYLIVFGIFGVLLISLVPALISQTTSFAVNLPLYLNKLPKEVILNTQLVNQAIGMIGSLPSQILTISLGILSNIVVVLTVLTFAFYLLLGRNKLNSQLGIFFSESRRKFVAELIDSLEIKLGGWARGQFTLMLIMGVVSYIYLTLLRIPYALPLSILVGTLEIVPFLGPILSATPAILIGLGISPITALLVALCALVSQQLESYILVPKIMQKSAGVSPIVVLLSLAVGFKLAGLFGTLIAVPVYITIQVVLQKYLKAKA